MDELERRLGAESLMHFVREGEDAFVAALDRIAYDAAWRPRLRVVFISGPTSSGKTTTAKRLASAFALYGCKTVTISMDDYYIPGRYIAAPSGLPDFETVDMLDLEAMGEDLRALLNGEERVIPRFDFSTRHRIVDPRRTLRIPEGGILLVEGLHSLDARLHRLLDREEYYGVFLMPYASLLTDRRALDSSDIRILRRISRDRLHRGANPLATLDYWPVIAQTEAQVFPPYLEAADVYINTVIPYEFFLIPSIAGRRIEEDLARAEEGTLPRSIFVEHGRLPDGHDYADLDAAKAVAERLLTTCKSLPAMDPATVPPNSILMEFIS